MGKREILYTTKDRYDYPFFKALAWILIPGVFMEVAILIFFYYEFAFILQLALAIFLIYEIADVFFMKKSYVELHEGYIQGISMGRLVKKGVAFTVEYSDITDVRTSDDILTVHTVYGKYRVQAYKCGERVKAMICKRMSQCIR